MDCKTTSERLSAYLDGELLQADAAAVYQHLGGCTRCAAELAELKALAGALEGLEEEAVPSGFAARVVEAAQDRRQPISIFGLGRARVLIRVAAGLIAVAGLWVGISLGASAFADRSPADRDQAQVGEEVTEESEFDMQIASLSATPPGSMAEAYLTFVNQSGGGPER